MSEDKYQPLPVTKILSIASCGAGFMMFLVICITFIIGTGTATNPTSPTNTAKTTTRVFLYMLNHQKAADEHMKNIESQGYKLIETKDACPMRSGEVVLPMIFQKEEQ